MSENYNSECKIFIQPSLKKLFITGCGGHEGDHGVLKAPYSNHAFQLRVNA